MDKSSSSFPEDIALCHQLIKDLLDNLEEKESLITKMHHQIEKMLRHRFGQRADRINPDQIELFAREILRVESEQEAAAGDNSEGKGKEKEKKKKKLTPHGRRPLPKDLPREVVEHDVKPEDRVCPKCGSSDCKCIGEEKSEQLEYIPASLKVIEHVRKKYVCNNPECEGAVITADKPWQPIEKGLPGPGMLSHVVVSKYCDHLPLNRQENILARHGIQIRRSTMCGWAMSGAELLKPLYDLMSERVIRSKVIKTDDTTIPVLDKGMTKTRTGRIWVYIGDDKNPYTVFDYTPTRGRDGPINFLGGFRGYLQADAYTGYNILFNSGDVIWVGCNAHARRYFVDAQSSDPVRALTAGAIIKSLYKVERLADEMGLDAKGRYELRQEKSGPIWSAFKKWLKEEVREILPKSPIGEAFRYVLTHWQGLTRYMEDGELEIDNNAAERALRLIVIGRKNWLFAGSDRGARTVAIMCSFTQTCKTLGIDPFEYLRDVFARIAAHPKKRLEELLPDKWRMAKKEAEKSSSQSPDVTPADFESELIAAVN